LARVPSCGAVLRRRTERRDGMQTALRRAEAQAAAALVDSLETAGATEAQVLGTDLAEAASEVRRLATLLRGLATDAIPDRRDRVTALRQRLDTACRARFAEGLASEFLAPLGAQAVKTDRAMQAVLETAARRLRALETEGRRIGGGPVYDSMLAEAVATVTAARPDAMLSMAHKVRLVELLAGPEAALALLEAVGV